MVRQATQMVRSIWAWQLLIPRTSVEGLVHQSLLRSKYWTHCQKSNTRSAAATNKVMAADTHAKESMHEERCGTLCNEENINRRCTHHPERTCLSIHQLEGRYFISCQRHVMPIPLSPQAIRPARVALTGPREQCSVCCTACRTAVPSAVQHEPATRQGVAARICLDPRRIRSDAVHAAG